MSKRLRKEIMFRSRKRNIYQKDPTSKNWNEFRIQRNKCTRMIRDAKRMFYSSLSIKDIKDNKRFWKTIKPMFSDKSINEKLKTLIEDGKIIDNKENIANIMNEYFVNITKSLDINQIPSDKVPSQTDEIDNIICMFRNHPSILQIKKAHPLTGEMTFKMVETDEMKKYIRDLKENKSSTEFDVPVKILKQFIDDYAEKLTAIYNDHCIKGTFPDSLKHADVVPLHKKGSKADKENFRPISKLPAISKVFERIMYDQLYDFMSTKLSTLLSGFRKGYGSQHALLHMLHNWRIQLDQGRTVAAVLMDLSKAFDCINHDLLIAKMHAYGVSKQAIKLLRNYLSNRRQRVGVDETYSTWLDLIVGVPQGSILGPLLFNIYLNDLMLYFTDSDVGICNYADDNTLYTSGDSVIEVKQNLKRSLTVVSSWFCNNGLQLNADKCNLIVFGKPRPSSLTLTFNGEDLEECQQVKLLGITIDRNLSFTPHVNTLCKRANAKIAALGRISCFMPPEKRKYIVNSFVASETNYCPLIWSFSSRSSLSKIERIHVKASALVCDNNSDTMHRLFCERLLKEIFKTKLGLNPSYMQTVFRFKNPHYNLRNGVAIVRNRTKTTKHGLQSVSYIGAQLWDSLPMSVKLASSVKSFCDQVRQLDTLNCKCRLCAEFVPNLGFTS